MNIRWLSFLSLLLPTALLLVACSEDPEEETVAPTLDSIQQNVFEVSCNFDSCHGANGGRGGLVLESDTARDALVGVTPQNTAAAGAGLQLVKPGAPDESFLLVKLESDVPEEFGDRMPQFSSGLPPEQIEAIRAWIEQGAP